MKQGEVMGTEKQKIIFKPEKKPCVDVVDKKQKIIFKPEKKNTQGGVMLDTYVKQGLVPRNVDREQAAHIVRTLDGSVFEFFKLYNKRDQFFDTLDIDNFLGV